MRRLTSLALIISKLPSYHTWKLGVQALLDGIHKKYFPLTEDLKTWSSRDHLPSRKFFFSLFQNLSTALLEKTNKKKNWVEFQILLKKEGLMTSWRCHLAKRLKLHNWCHLHNDARGLRKVWIRGLQECFYFILREKPDTVEKGKDFWHLNKI